MSERREGGVGERVCEPLITIFAVFVSYCISVAVINTSSTHTIAALYRDDDIVPSNSF